MHSLRLRLALLSSLVSGLVILLLGGFIWGVIYNSHYEAVDLRLSLPVDRIVRDMHPRMDASVIISRIESGMGEDIAMGNRAVILKDDQWERTVFQTHENSWFSTIDSDFLEGAPGELVQLQNSPDRPEFMKGDPRFRDPFYEEGDATEDNFPDNLVGENRPVEPPVESNDGEIAELDLDFLREFLGDDVPRGTGPPTGQKGFKSKGRDGGRARNPEIKYLTAEVEGEAWRFASIRERGYSVVIGANLNETEKELASILKGFWIGIPLALIFIGGTGWFVANHALRPVRGITETASKITATGLYERIPDGQHMDRELSELTGVLNQMMDRLEHSFQHANRFSADVSHELKTPLTIMQGEVATALSGCEPGSDVEKNLLSVQREAQRLKTITGSLMMLAQADSGSMVTRRRTISLSDEIEALCEDAEILCEQKELTLSAEIQRNVEFKTDPDLLRQALQNLISNAIKYNEEGGKVSVLLEQDDEEIIISVANTGAGIAEDERGKIFDRFHRADKARSRNIDGFGLGLNLALEIIRGLGGDLSLAKATFEITKFEVRFPT